VVLTHDQEEARSMSDSLHVLPDTQAHLVMADLAGDVASA
jgi:hypothetical protein